MADFSSLTGLFKEAYADKLEDLIPEFSILQSEVDFVKDAEKNGNLYHQPVIVQNENGFTYAAAASDGYTLNASASLVTQDAQIAGSQIVLNSLLGFNAAARSKNKNSFMTATSLLVENMMNSLSKRVELSLLYGGTDLGQATSSVNTNATTTVITLTAATFAGGIWAGSVGSQLSMFNASSGAIVNSNAALVISAVDTTSTVRSITITGNATDIAAVDTLLATATDGALNFYGARATSNVYTECSGIDKIITNTGTLFNISASAYDLWKGNTYAVGGNLTEAVLDAGLSQAVNKGLQEEVTVYVNPLTWTFLNKDQAALRMFDSSYKDQATNGFNEIVYKSVAGTQKIVAHPFVKQGEAFAVPTSRIKRLGATPMTFQGLEENATTPVFFQLTNVAGYGITAYSNQAILIETPARCVKFTGITNV